MTFDDLPEQEKTAIKQAFENEWGDGSWARTKKPCDLQIGFAAGWLESKSYQQSINQSIEVKK